MDEGAAARSRPYEVLLPDPVQASCGRGIPGHGLSEQFHLITTTSSGPCFRSPTAPIEKLEHQMESEGELSTAMPLQMCEIQSDAESTTKLNIHMDSGFMTPNKSTSVPFCDSSYTPECDELITPSKGMHFPDVDAAKQFYESYAHHAGFSVRVGQHKSKDGVISHKRFLCAKEGFREEKIGESISGPSTKRKRERKITRCGCGAKLAIKRTKEDNYVVTIFEQEHNHVLVSPSKQQFMRSNRKINDKAKSTLFNCHRACIGTSAAYRFLRVGLGGFKNVGCTKRDLQNFHRTLRCLIKSSDAQMFVDQLARKNLANPGFYFDYVIDDKGRLVHVFWADAICRKNYKHFGQLVSFDSTYSTNEYNMIFAPFTGVNHHKASVFFGAAFLHDEKIESFEWLFRTFLKAMGGDAPTLMITDECASMISAIGTVFPTTTHRLCMWHIMKKVGEKVGPDLKTNTDFHDRLGLVVWASETPSEFEQRWFDVMSEFGLQDNEWFIKRFKLRESWVPAYFNDIPLSGLLRTTSRSESANAFFSRIIGYKHAFVEFWLRFETALEEQRHKELQDDNLSLHTSPPLKTSWGLEKHGSEVFTHEVFSEFQKEILADREYCLVESMTKEDDVVITTIVDCSKKVRTVRWNTSTMFGTCTCMLFEKYGIPCRHLIHMLRTAKLQELPAHYVLKRFTKNCKVDAVFDEDGILLGEIASSSMDIELKKTIADTCKKMEGMLTQAKQSLAGIQFFRDGIFALAVELNKIVPSKKQTPAQEFEEFLGCTIPDEVSIHPPNDIRSRGKIKRIKGHNEKGAKQSKKGKKNKEKAPQLCQIQAS